MKFEHIWQADFEHLSSRFVFAYLVQLFFRLATGLAQVLACSVWLFMQQVLADLGQQCR